MKHLITETFCHSPIKTIVINYKQLYNSPIQSVSKLGFTLNIFFFIFYQNNIKSEKKNHTLDGLLTCRSLA
jgi:hypothetical protein